MRLSTSGKERSKGECVRPLGAERFKTHNIQKEEEMGMQTPDGNVGVPVNWPKDAIEELFTYHSPTEAQFQSYLAIREAAKDLARMIDANCPAGPDRTTAIRKIREAVMTANASIATGNVQYR